MPRLRTRKCPHCRKNLYRSYRVAKRQMMRLPERGYVYWHPEGGGYCLTSMQRPDYDRVQARVNTRTIVPTPPPGVM